MLVLVLAPVAVRRDRVGIRLSLQGGVTLNNTLVGRRIGSIGWAQIAGFSEDGRGRIVLTLRDPSSFMSRIPPYLATALISGISVSARLLSVSESELKGIVRSAGELWLEPDHGDSRSGGASVEIHAVRARYLRPFGMASTYLYILLAVLVMAAVMQLVVGAPGGLNATFFATAGAAVVVAAINPGYGVLFLRQRVVRTTPDGVDEIGLFGRRRHHPFAGLRSVRVCDGLASFGEPTVSIQLRYEGSSRRRVISGKGMRSDQMRTLGVLLEACCDPGNR